MSGIAKICKLYGSIRFQSGNETVTWVWDYAKDKSVLKTEMTKEEWIASEREKYRGLTGLVNVK
jgi:hypothetical protein